MDITLPSLSSEDWRRMIVACPIKYKGNMPKGDFLMCDNVSKTQFSEAKVHGNIMIGNRRFVYVPEHDKIVRIDFLMWVLDNCENVLRKISKKVKTSEEGKFFSSLCYVLNHAKKNGLTVTITNV